MWVESQAILHQLLSQRFVLATFASLAASFFALRSWHNTLLYAADCVGDCSTLRSPFFARGAFLLQIGWSSL